MHPQQLSVWFLDADMCDQSQFLFIANLHSSAWMDHSLFTHLLGDGIFGVFPSQSHKKAALDILIHAFC